MKCPVCDAQVADNAKFCGVCGTPMPAAPVAPQPVQAPPVQQQWNNNPVPPVQPSQNQFYGGTNQPVMPPQQNNMYYVNQRGYATQGNNPAGMSMKWYKFLIYFSLFAGAFLNFCSAVTYFTGAVYEADVPGGAEIVYGRFDALEVIDKIFAVILIVSVVLQLVARFQLARFKIKAPTTLTMVYVISIIASIFYMLMFTVVVGNFVIDMMSTLLSSVIVEVVVMILNMIYFKKRKHMFVN